MLNATYDFTVNIHLLQNTFSLISRPYSGLIIPKTQDSVQFGHPAFNKPAILPGLVGNVLVSTHEFLGQQIKPVHLIDLLCFHSSFNFINKRASYHQIFILIFCREKLNVKN